jgi:hypothetical protein
MADIAAADMASDRLHGKDKSAEEAWIAKYRSALKEIPVQPSRSTMLREGLNRAHSMIISHLSGILARSWDASHWKRDGNEKRSAQFSKSMPVSQSPATRNRNLAESSVKVA